MENIRFLKQNNEIVQSSAHKVVDANGSPIEEAKVGRCIQGREAGLLISCYLHA